MSKVCRIYGGVKQCKWSCRPLQGMRCCIQGWHDCQHVDVKSCRPCTSVVHLGMEVVGYMEPYVVVWLKVVRNGCAHFCVVCNFARVATGVGNTSHLSC